MATTLIQFRVDSNVKKDMEAWAQQTKGISSAQYAKSQYYAAHNRLVNRNYEGLGSIHDLTSEEFEKELINNTKDGGMSFEDFAKGLYKKAVEVTNRNHQD